MKTRDLAPRATQQYYLENAQAALWIWVAASNAQPYPSELISSRGNVNVVFQASQMPTLIIPPISRPSRVAEVVRKLQLPQTENARVLSLTTVMSLLHERRSCNKLARELQPLLLDWSSLLLNKYLIDNSTDLTEYICLRLAMLQALQRRVFDCRKRKPVYVARFETFDGTFCVTFQTRRDQFVAVLKPDSILGLDSHEFRFPKLSSEDVYGIAQSRLKSIRKTAVR